MNVVTFEFPTEWEELELYPLSDLHIGDPKTDISLFRRFVQMIAEKPNRFLIYVGDNMNNAIKSSVSNVYNETMSPNEQRKFLVRELESIKDRFLFFVDGNHEYRSKKDVDLSPVEWLAGQLGCFNYSEDEAALKVCLGKGENGKRIAYNIYVTYGAGGGKRPGAAVNNIELLALSIEGADIVVIGHVHKRIGYKVGSRRFDPYNNVLRETEKLCVISSSWQNYGGYAARKMLVPGAKGAVPIILSGKEKLAKAVI